MAGSALEKKKTPWPRYQASASAIQSTGAGAIAMPTTAHAYRVSCIEPVLECVRSSNRAAGPCGHKITASGYRLGRACF